ncbi:hypothetical protein KJ855_03995 [Patescibacteria group bacterium]|nr:hypothetical protein [Patescibacteria group bacterium]
MSENKLIKPLLVLVFLNIVCWSHYYLHRQTPKNTITFFDIGQGDSFLIQTRHNTQILIDGGPDNTILSHLSDSIPFYDKTIELSILTHPHEDHLNGILYTNDYYRIEKTIFNKIPYDNSTFDSFKKEITNQNISFSPGQAGQRIIIDNQYYLDILYPFNNYNANDSLDINDQSIALKLTSPHASILFLADLSSDIEQKLIDKYGDLLDIDIIKIGHHGSKYSTSKLLLQTTTPDIAVISCGENNKYGHPHTETIDLLNQYHIKILRTDVEGNISFDI